MSAVPTATSGRRLRAVFADAGSVRHFLHFVDLETGLRCLPGPSLFEEGGPDRCWPIHRGLVRSGADCGGAFEGSRLFLDWTDQPYVIGFDLQGFRILRVGRAAPVDSSACPAHPRGLSSFEFEDVPESVFAAGTLSAHTTGYGAVQVEVFEGEDESRAVVNLHDPELGISCRPRSTDRGDRCLPSPAVGAVWELDTNQGGLWVDAATCSRRVVAYPIPIEVLEQPAFQYARREGDVFSLGFRREFGRFLSTNEDEVAFIDASGTCEREPEEMVPNLYLGFLEPLGPEAFEPMSFQRQGERVTLDIAELPGFEDLAYAIPTNASLDEGLIDRDLNTPCFPQYFGGTVRCLPLLSAGAVYSDPSCELRVVRNVGGSLPIYVGSIASYAREGLLEADVFQSTGTAQNGSLFTVQDGNCVLTQEGEYFQLEPAAPETFAPLEIVQE